VLFGHFLVQVLVLVYHIRMSFAGVRALVWIASGIGHWKEND